VIITQLVEARPLRGRGWTLMGDTTGWMYSWNADENVGAFHGGGRVKGERKDGRVSGGDWLPWGM